MRKNKIFSFLDVSIIVVATAFIMYFLGGILIYRHLGGINYAVMSNDENLKQFISAYNELLDHYYDNLDKNQLIEGAINGMYSKVSDPYTTYMDSKTTTTLNDSLKGEYRGIGIKIESKEDGSVRVADVFEDSPAKASGLQVGDIITHVNGKDITKSSNTEIATMIKETTEDKTSITINRNNNTLTFNVSVENLMVPVVESELISKDNQNIGYIKLTVFNNTADVQFDSALTKLENSNMSSLIIDLRDNSGGYLEVCKNIAEMFIEKDKVIYSLESKDSKTTYKDKTNEKRTYKVVVLTNKNSASASEILAAALKYSYGATIIGEKTYGKGKVQERSNLSNGTTLKYTTAKWLTPNGDCIDGVGLKPTYEVIFDKEIYDKDDKYNTDSQILYSIDYLAD